MSDPAPSRYATVRTPTALWLAAGAFFVGMLFCGAATSKSNAPRTPAPVASAPADACRPFAEEIASCHKTLEDATTLIGEVKARLAALQTAKATVRTTHPTNLLAQGMALEDVEAILGPPKRTQMSTCGSAVGQPWSCMVRNYCTPKGCVDVTYAGAGATWLVNGWQKPLF
jgi:hypothetical protein